MVERGRLTCLVDSFEKMMKTIDFLKTSPDVLGCLRALTSKLSKSFQFQVEHQVTLGQFAWNQSFISRIFNLIEVPRDKVISLHALDILLTILNSSVEIKRKFYNHYPNSTNVLLKAVNQEAKLRDCSDEFLLLAHRILAIIGVRDSKFSAKARSNQTMKTTVSMLKKHVNHVDHTVILLRVVKLCSTEGQAMLILSKTNIISTLMEIFSIYSSKNEKVLKLTLLVLILVFRSKANVDTFLSQGGLEMILEAIDDWTKEDTKNKSTKMRTSLLLVLNQIVCFRSGIQAMQRLYGINQLFRQCKSLKPIKKLDSLSMLYCNVMRKCLIANKLPVPSLAGPYRLAHRFPDDESAEIGRTLSAADLTPSRSFSNLGPEAHDSTVDDNGNKTTSPETSTRMRNRASSPDGSFGSSGRAAFLNGNTDVRRNKLLPGTPTEDLVTRDFSCESDGGISCRDVVYGVSCSDCCYLDKTHSEQAETHFQKASFDSQMKSKISPLSDLSTYRKFFEEFEIIEKMHSTCESLRNVLESNSCSTGPCFHEVSSRCGFSDNCNKTDNACGSPVCSSTTNNNSDSSTISADISTGNCQNCTFTGNKNSKDTGGGLKVQDARHCDNCNTNVEFTPQSSGDLLTSDDRLLANVSQVQQVGTPSSERDCDLTRSSSTNSPRRLESDESKKVETLLCCHYLNEPVEPARNRKTARDVRRSSPDKSSDVSADFLDHRSFSAGISKLKRDISMLSEDSEVLPKTPPSKPKPPLLQKKKFTSIDECDRRFARVDLATKKLFKSSANKKSSSKSRQEGCLERRTSKRDVRNVWMMDQQFNRILSSVNDDTGHNNRECTYSKLSAQCNDGSLYDGLNRSDSQIFDGNVGLVDTPFTSVSGLTSSYDRRRSDTGRYLWLASQTRSVARFTKVAYPDLHGHVLPSVQENVQHSKKVDTIRKKMMEDINRQIDPSDVMNSVVYSLDDVIMAAKFAGAMTSGDTELKNEDEEYIMESLSNMDKNIKGCQHLCFDSQFESGNLRKAIRVREYEYDLILMPDTNTKGQHQWFYFQVSNMKNNVQYKFNIINCEKANSQLNYGMQPLLYSVAEALMGRPCWVRAGQEVCYYRNHIMKTPILVAESRLCNQNFYHTASFCITFPHSPDVCYIAYHYPYTYTSLVHHLDQLESSVNVSEDINNYNTFVQNDDINYNTNEDANSSKNNRKGNSCLFFRRQSLCKTVEGNDVPLLTITSLPVLKDDLNTDLETLSYLKSRPYVFLTGRVHPGESNASWVMRGTLDFLLSNSTAAQKLRENFVFKVVPMLNPGGVINGNHRCSLFGEDLNRQWLEPVAAKHDSIFHTKSLMSFLQSKSSSPIYLYCDYHGHSRKKNVFLYGCSPSKSWIVDDQNNPTLLQDKTEDRSYMAIPVLLEQSAPAFQLSACSFTVERVKEATARVVVWRHIGVVRSYTMESTYCGFDQGPYKGQQINTYHHEEMGRDFLIALLKSRAYVDDVTSLVATPTIDQLSAVVLESKKSGSGSGASKSDSSDGEDLQHLLDEVNEMLKNRSSEEGGRTSVNDY